MMTSKAINLLVAAVITIGATLIGAVAHAELRHSELHLRTGYFYSKYTGPLENEVSVPGVLDVEYSTFTSTRTAVTFRAMNVIEFPNIKNDYSFSGVGLRFFTAGPAYAVNAEEGGFAFTTNPRWRTYYGFEVGLAQATVQSYGNVLQTSSSLVMVHGNVGAIYGITPSVGFSTQLNAGFGGGYSAVSVLATNVSLLTGICFFF